MELETYKTVTFTNRLMQALEQLRAVDGKIEERAEGDRPCGDREFLRECSKELRDTQKTLLILNKEVLYYMTQ